MEGSEFCTLTLILTYPWPIPSGFCKPLAFTRARYQQSSNHYQIYAGDTGSVRRKPIELTLPILWCMNGVSTRVCKELTLPVLWCVNSDSTRVSEEQTSRVNITRTLVHEWWQYQGLLCKQCQYQGLQGATSRVNITCTLLCEWCQYQGLREKQTSRVNITCTLVHERQNKL